MGSSGAGIIQAVLAFTLRSIERRAEHAEPRPAQPPDRLTPERQALPIGALRDA